MNRGVLSIAALALSFVDGCGSAANSPTRTADASLDEAPADSFSAEPSSDAPATTTDVAVTDVALAVGADSVDAGAPDVPSDLHQPPSAPYPRPTYALLSETGLYSNFATLMVAPGIEEFRPTHVLWSDGAEKRRFIALPAGTQIDTSDMDHWVFPIGTRFWKEFSRDGVRLETRLIERYGEGPEDYWFGAFVWQPDQEEAVFAVDGQENINSTQHDAPPQKYCPLCHAGDAGRVLGFSALQLSRKEAGMTLDALAQANRLSNPPPPGADFHAPGDPITAAALGYFHANCGHCHNLHGPSWPDTQMVFRLNVADTVATETEVYKTMVGQKLQYWRHDGFAERVVPGEPAQSAVFFRMNARGTKDQMPPLATEIIDPSGIDSVKRWIESLPK